MTTNEPTDNSASFVDPNTDDLDAFSDLLNNKAKPAEPTPTETEEPETPEDDADNSLAPEDENEDNEQDEAEDEHEDESSDEPEDKPVKKSKNRFQERIDDLTAARREAERKIQELERRLNESQQKPEPEKAAPVKVAEDDSPKPDAKNEDGSDKYPLGEFDPDYIRDLTRHTIQKEQTAANERQEQERNERQANEAKEQLQSQWVEKLNPALEKHTDFMEKTVQLEDTFKNLDPAYSEYLANTIKAMDNGPDVLYHLANNLDEAQRFVAMGPVMATMALGRYQALVSEQAKQTPAKVSKAPSPPPQVNKGSKTRVVTPDDTDDLDAFEQKFFTKRK